MKRKRVVLSFFAKALSSLICAFIFLFVQNMGANLISYKDAPRPSELVPLFYLTSKATFSRNILTATVYDYLRLIICPEWNISL